MGVDADVDDVDDKDDDDTVDADVSVDGTDGIPTEAAVSGNALDLSMASFIVREARSTPPALVAVALIVSAADMM